MNKKYNIWKVALTCTFLMVSILLVKKAYSKIVLNVPPDISAEEVKAVVIEDFEQTKEGDWKIESVPRQYKKDKANSKKNPVPILDLKIIKGAPSDLRVEPWSHNNKGLKKTQCLGVHVQFKYPGHNSIHIIPPKPIYMPGRTKGFSMWVHGRGKAYTLEAWIKDYKGNVHVLKFQDSDGVRNVNFVGWKPMKAYVPPFIPQIIESYPQTKTLSLERFVLRADPKENTEEVYFFFDQIKSLTETFEVNFDGQGLEKAFDKSGGKEKPEETTDDSK